MSQAERGTRSELPRKPRGVASWGTRGEEGGRGARRTGRPAGQPRSGAVSLTCRPLGCLLFPPWHRSTSLQSHFWRPSPEPRAGARGLSRLSGSPPPPARWLLGRHSASVPLTIPPATPPPRARDPPLWVADTDGCAGWLEVEADCHVQRLIRMCLESWKLDYPTFSYKWTLRACLEVLAGELSYSYTLDRRAVLLYWGRSSSSTERTA
ncbi:uncharacterized protein LOC132505257 isoform X1 [Lagenorhynchus albirostris]|uniref:uncharacterized protein LOC132505257 isoform X1 n=1 Tax=Lagenorhynchus albirostris TaxID=27610 RepID=UPI0028E78728|nr:uncharacterized protein LOC132505257 isoform X1 [Lagenorhynchus albirostris]